VSTTLHGSTSMGSTEKWCGQNADHTTLNLTSIQVVGVWLSDISSPIDTITL
jgi:hypothetical protein